MATQTKTFHLELISPDKQLVSCEVVKLVAKSESGEVGILPGHADMVAKLAEAPLKFYRDDKDIEVVAVLGGVLEVKDDRVTVITDFAMFGTEIDEAQAAQEAEKVKTELQIQANSKSKNKDENRQLALMEYKLKTELLKLQAARMQKAI